MRSEQFHKNKKRLRIYTLLRVYRMSLFEAGDWLIQFYSKTKICNGGKC
jgi:hypothetical protein